MRDPQAVDWITSRSNPKVKQVRALRQRKARQESGLFIVEGIRPVGEAIDAEAPLDTILYAPERLSSDYARELIAEQQAHGVPCLALSADVFDSLADKENPQGILAVVQMQNRRLADLDPAGFAWGVALVAPQDPGNVGTIMRTIDAVGADGLLLLDGGVDAYHPSAVRAAMGAGFRFPVVTAGFDEFAAWSRRHGYHVFGSSAHGSVDYRQVGRYPQPCILLLGSERQGLSPEQAAVCEQVVRLPMRGRVTSLNLAVAAGVLLYAMLTAVENSPADVGISPANGTTAPAGAIDPA